MIIVTKTSIFIADLTIKILLEKLYQGMLYNIIKLSKVGQKVFQGESYAYSI